MRTLMCAVVALMWTGVVHAGDTAFMTGNQLLAFCKYPHGSETRAACVAYVEAVADTLGVAAWDCQESCV
jgi:hypothetical protein